MEKARINFMLLNWNWNYQYELVFSFIHDSLKKKKMGPSKGSGTDYTELSMAKENLGYTINNDSTGL